MNVLGIGTDITEIERVERMLERHGEFFRTRVYTDTELEYCQARKNEAQHFAGRWAAKEAILKAVGTGWITGISWRDVEVVNEPSGKPVVRLHRGALEEATKRGIREILITISHCDCHAVAFATALGDA
jgi:holo-[acyl-carrier protein] synthase